MKIKDYLENNGFKLIDRGNFWHSNAAFRGGDNPTALQIYKDSGCWKDHVNSSEFKPFAALVEAIGRPYDGIIHADHFEKEDFITMEKTFDLSILERLMPAHGFYNTRGISSKKMQILKSGFANSGKLHSRYVFPIFSTDASCIIGFTGRYVGKISDNIPKWKHIGKKRNWVYPIWENSPFEKAVEEKSEIILVESIGDFLALYEAGILNVAVTFGTAVSDNLISHLARFQNLKITIAFNNDSSELSPGILACAKAYLKIIDFFGVGKVDIKLPETKDFGDWLAKNGTDFVKIWRNKPSDTDFVFEFCKKISEQDGAENFIKVTKEYDKLKRKQN